MTSAGAEISDWVQRFAHLVEPPGEVLDLACGAGRHARWFALRGHRVTAVDVDADRLEALRCVDGVEVVAADLEAGPWPLPGRAFAGVVVVNFLHRPLFDALLGAVAPGGALIYQTFAVGNERFGRPRSPDHLLREGELLDAVAGRLTVVAYEHGRALRGGRTAVVQRLAAVRAPSEPRISAASWPS